MNDEYVFINSAAGIAEVLVHKTYEFEKPRFIRDTLVSVLGHGLVLAEGDQHKAQRRKLLPAFSFRHIKDLYPIFWQKSREVVQAMTLECGDSGAAEIEVTGWASRVSLDIIGTAGLGRDFEAISDEHNEIVRTYMLISHPSKVDRTLMLMCSYIGSVLPVSLMMKAPFPRVKEAVGAATLIRGVCRDLIQRKRAKMEKDELEDVDICSIAIKSNLFNEEGLINQLMTFLGAGHETTGSSLTWAVYLLCIYRDAQEKLRKEIRENLPSVDSPEGITSVDIDRLPYLNAVCNEVIRLYSPVPQTMREALHDTTIQDLPIRKGTRIVISAWGTNTDRNLWGPDAAEFRPERWLTVENGGDAKTVKDAAVGGATSNYAYLSFLHGPRSCIGQSFAKAEFACLLAAWIGRFDFELKDKTLLDQSKMVVEQLVTAKATDGLYVHAKVVPGY